VLRSQRRNYFAHNDGITSLEKRQNQSMAQKILILGGTGFVGRHVCEKLVDAQLRVTVPTRRRQNASHILMLPTLEVVEANIHDEATLQQLIGEHDAVVNLVAILQGNEASFDKAHVQLAVKIARACEAAGVRRVVHVSALGADARNPDGLPSMYLRSKSRGEQVLRQAALDLTVLRPSVIFGAEDKFLNVFAQLQQFLPVMPLAGASAMFQPVWVQDVASAIVHCLEEKNFHSTTGQTYEACGPEVFSLRQLVQLAGQYAGVNHGRGRPVIALPNALARVQARLMELMPGEPVLSRDNLDSMKVPNIATGHVPGLRDLGIEPAALSAVAPTYLGARGLRSGLMAKRKTAGRMSGV
jgi:NADH dehydrogenase